MRLSEMFDLNSFVWFVEEMLTTEDVIFDAGCYVEIYGNLHDGKYDENSSKGSSWFVYFDQDVAYREILDACEKEGLYVRHESMTIRIIPKDDSLFEQERGFAQAWSVQKVA